MLHRALFSQRSCAQLWCKHAASLRILKHAAAFPHLSWFLNGFTHCSAPSSSTAVRLPTGWDFSCPLSKWQSPASFRGCAVRVETPFPVVKWRRGALVPRPPQAIARLRGHAVDWGGFRCGLWRGRAEPVAERYRTVRMEVVRRSLCPAALLCAWLLLGSSWGLGPPGIGAAYVLDDAGGLGREFDGIGAISGGGVRGCRGTWGWGGSEYGVGEPGQGEESAGERCCVVLCCACSSVGSPCIPALWAPFALCHGWAGLLQSAKGELCKWRVRKNFVFSKFFMLYLIL